EALEELAAFGYATSTVDDLMQRYFHKHFLDVLGVCEDLEELFVERELDFVEKQVKCQMRAATSKEDVLRLAESWQESFRVGGSVRQKEAFQLATRMISEEATMIINRPKELVQRATTYTWLHKLGLTLDTQHLQYMSLGDALKDVEADPLFAAAIRPEDVFFLAQEQLRQPAEPALCRHADVKKLISEQAEAFQQAAFKERCRRYHLEVCRLLAPLGRDPASVWMICEEFLRVENPESNGEAFSKFLQGALQVCSSGEELAAIEEVNVLAQGIGISESRLSAVFREQLQFSIEHFCSSVVEAAFGELQVMLFSDCKLQLHDKLKELGVDVLAVKPNHSWGADKAWNIALRSSTALQTVLKHQATFKPFQKMGLQLPPIKWVSKFSNKALECWKDHVCRSSSEEDVIEYKDTFEQAVACLYERGNSFSAAGEEIEVRVRFSLVLFPVRFELSPDLLHKICPRLQFHADSPMAL
ncbi:unnamed protein product, partial [Durusdinium trenchii]